MKIVFYKDKISGSEQEKLGWSLRCLEGEMMKLGKKRKGKELICRRLNALL